MDNWEISENKICLHGLYKNYGALPILQDINLTAKAGEFVTLIGPSGCGKSTIFNILAGLEPADAGQVLLDNRPVTGPGNVAFMPQRDLLMPWRTILDNVIIGPELRGKPKKETRQKALGLFETFGLKGFEKNYPFQLSGGMRQRAALLRTILLEREVLLLDEPFGALDALTRASLQDWLLRLQNQLKHTVLFITHDVEEALLLSDKIYVLSPRPASVRLVKEISLLRPRLITSPEFVALKAELIAVLKAEGAYV